jgi:hypothetical protein
MHCPLPLLMCLLSAVCLRAQVLNEVEPNDIPPQANFVAPGTQIDCVLTPGDVDWFVFSTSGGRVSLFTSALGATSVDTVLELFDLAGTTSLGYGDDARGALSDLSMNLPAGTYLLRVSGFSPSTTGGYSLDATETFVLPFTMSESEPNDTLATADVLPPGNCRVDVDAGLSGPLDEDWYKITVSSPRSGIWFLINEGNAPFLSQHRYEVYDGNGVLVQSSALGTNAADNSAKAISTSQIRCWPMGTYYLVVKNRSNASGSPFNKVLVGKYRLEYLEIPLNTGAPVAESVEPNSSVATATPITAGDWGTGSLTNGDMDWWLVHANGRGTLMVQTRGGNAPALTDSTIRLYDAKGKLLGLPSLDGNLLDGSAHARLTASINIALPGDYFVEVTSGPVIPVGVTLNYALEVGLIPCNPYLTAEYHKKDDDASCLGSAAGVRVEYSTLGSGELPIVGSTFVRVATRMPSFSGVLQLIGFSDSFFSGGPLPFDLSSLGAPGCTLNVDPLLIYLYVSDAAGRARFQTSLPVSPVFAGFTLYEQLLVLDPPANPLGATLSNSIEYTIGTLSY